MDCKKDDPAPEKVDNCKNCPVPDDPRFYDIESEDYFTCSMCACNLCQFLHECCGQCAENKEAENK